jgi:hypothetical protein
MSGDFMLMHLQFSRAVIGCDDWAVGGHTTREAESGRTLACLRSWSRLSWEEGFRREDSASGVVVAVVVIVDVVVAAAAAAFGGVAAVEVLLDDYDMHSP